MSASNLPETSSILWLHDGRALGYAEVGKSDGFPIFYFHGYDSSRLEVLLWREWAVTLGVRMIALDRPGIGRSDLKAGFRLLDWPDDVVEVANHLGIERFAVAAASGGGAYGLHVPTKSRAGSRPVASSARSLQVTSSRKTHACGCGECGGWVSIFPGSIVSLYTP